MRSSVFKLKLSEWLLTTLFGSLLFIIYLSAKIQAYFLAPIDCVDAGTVEVYIHGEVVRPGKYLLEKGTTVKEVLRRAKCKKFADISEVKLDEKIDLPREVVVKKLTTITAKIIGTSSGDLECKMPVGSRYCDLSKFWFAREMDPKFLKSRRKLSPEEVIFIKKKDSLE